MTMTTYLTPMNRFRFIRSIKSNDDALYCEKIFNQISFTPEQLMDLRTLHRYATTLHRLDENACNGWPMPVVEYRDGKMYRFEKEDIKWRERDEKTESRIERDICTICERNKWTVEHQGDPRGWPLKLIINEIDCSVLVNYR